MNDYNENSFSAWGMPPPTPKEEYPEQEYYPSRLEQINILLDNRLDTKKAISVVNKSNSPSEKILSALHKEINRIDEELSDIK